MGKLSFLTWNAVIVCLLPIVAVAQGGLDQRVNDLSLQISKEMALYRRTTIAVVEFTDLRGTVTDLGRFLSEELITRLYQTRRFKVVERQLLNKVLSEQALSLTGVINPASAKQLGQVLGVDAIVSGTITDLAQSLKVNARLINTETGEIFSVAATEIFKDESVIRLLENRITNSNTSVSKMPPSTGTSSYSGKGIAPGIKFEFQDKVFEVEKRLRVTLQSIEILEKNVPRVNLTIENLFGETRSFQLDSPKSLTYILDQHGEPYAFGGVTQFVPGTYKSLPADIPVRFSLLFKEIPSSTTKLSLVVRIYSNDSYDCTFKNLELR